MAQTDEAADLIDWILRHGRDDDDLGTVLEGFCTGLRDRGIPLLRASLSMPTIDPVAAVLSFVWWRHGGLSAERLTPDAAWGAGYQRSPILYLLQRNRWAERWKLEDPDVVRQFPLFEELRALGATEYAVQFMPFSGRRTAIEGVALTMATDRPGGFTDAEVAAVIRILPALSLVAYRIGLMHVASQALGAYLGPNTGARVLQGKIRRGDSQTISAALLLADLRGFTALTEREDGLAVVGWLNEHLEAIGDPVAERGGEVLKFLGDGLLAVFPVGEVDAVAACANAAAAASEALARNAGLNARRAAAGAPVLDLILVLHFGDVVYGNIGTARRLDFTVIGRAVNEASRMEALGKQLVQPLLLSESFARRCGKAVVSLGRHALRGIAGEREIFVLDAASGQETSEVPP